MKKSHYISFTGTSETLKKKNLKKIDKQKNYVQLKLAGFRKLTKFIHPVTLQPEVTGG